MKPYTVSVFLRIDGVRLQLQRNRVEGRLSFNIIIYILVHILCCAMQDGPLDSLEFSFLSSITKRCACIILTVPYEILWVLQDKKQDNFPKSLFFFCNVEWVPSFLCFVSNKIWGMRYWTSMGYSRWLPPQRSEWMIHCREMLNDSFATRF